MAATTEATSTEATDEVTPAEAKGVTWDLSDLFAGPDDPRLEEALGAARAEAEQLAAAYRGRIADALPSGVPPEAAAAARDTLGGAVAAAGQLPDPLGEALLEAARQAFVEGLHVAFAMSAAAAIGAAILAAVVLRGVQVSSQPDGQPDLGPGQAGPGDVGVGNASGAP
jgi:DHA2 family multidrug resistance protein-like MFS transporter